MTAILDAIDDALTAYADHLGSPWPGRIPVGRELLTALFGPERGDPVPSRTDMEVTAIDWASEQVAMLEDCGGAGECIDHEPRAEVMRWALPGAWGSSVAFTFVPRPPQMVLRSLAWLAEEDAWLADRATREAATR